MHSNSEAIPTALKEAKISRLTGQQLASPAYCTAQGALTAQQLNVLQGNASEVLTAEGCLCLADPYVRQDEKWSPTYTDAITTAMEAIATRKSLPMDTLVSKEHLGSSTFNSLCSILADVSPIDKDSFWHVLKQCSVLEDVKGQSMCLHNPDFMVLPNQDWEQTFSFLECIPWTAPIVKHHLATAVQRRLLQHAPSASRHHWYTANHWAPSLTKCCCQRYTDGAYPLPRHCFCRCWTTSLQSKTFASLCQSKSLLTTGLTASAKQWPTTASCYHSCLQSSISQLLTSLPAVYSEHGRLPTLICLGLAHEGTPDPFFFTACAKQFQQLAQGQMTQQQTYIYSQKLVRMLHSNLHAYLRADSSTARSLATLPVYRRAMQIQGQSGSGGTTSDLVSLADIEDYSFHRLVSSAAALTDPAMGDTMGIRTLLGLPAGPQPINVIKHLLNTAQARNRELSAGTAAKTVPSSVQDDVKEAYSIIVDTVSNLLTASGAKQELSKIATMLSQSPWVLVQCKKFVLPELLYFDLDEESAEGKPMYRVLTVLLLSFLCFSALVQCKSVCVHAMSCKPLRGLTLHTTVRYPIILHPALQAHCSYVQCTWLICIRCHATLTNATQIQCIQVHCTALKLTAHNITEFRLNLSQAHCIIISIVRMPTSLTLPALIPTALTRTVFPPTAAVATALMPTALIPTALVPTALSCSHLPLT